MSRLHIIFYRGCGRKVRRKDGTTFSGNRNQISLWLLVSIVYIHGVIFDKIHPKVCVLKRSITTYRDRWRISAGWDDRSSNVLANEAMVTLQWLAKRAPPAAHSANVRFQPNVSYC